MIDLGTLKMAVKVDAENGINTLKDVGNNSENAGNKLGKLPSVLKGLAIGGAIALSLKAVVDGLIDCSKKAMEFETSFAKVNTLLDKNTTDLGAYKDEILKTSNETGVSVGELSESIYNSISAGVDQSDAIGFTSEAVKLAKGGFTDTSKAVDLMTTALNGYGLETEKSTEIADMLITTQNLGKTTVDELAGSMGAVIPIANNANFGMEELGTSYALLTQKGIATNEAGTMIKSMLGEITTNGSKADKTLRELTGKGFTDLKNEGASTTEILALLDGEAQRNNSSLKDMFGSMEAGTAALTLMSSGGSEYNNILSQMQNSAGATTDAYNIMSNTTQEQMGKLKNSFENIGISLGEKFLPLIGGLVDFMNEHMPQIQAVFDTVFGAIGLVINGVIDTVKWFGSICNDETTAVGQTFKLLKDTIGSAIGLIKGVIEDWIANFKEFWGQWGESITFVVQNTFDNIKFAIDLALKAIKGIIDFFIKILKGDWDGAFKGLKKVATDIFDDIKEFIAKALDKIVYFVKNIAPDLFNAGKEIFTSLWDGIKNIWSSISDWVSEKVGWLMDKVMFWKDESSKMDNSDVDGSHRTGLREVPYDGYRAILHKGERVLTQPEAKVYEKGGNNTSPTNYYVTQNISTPQNPRRIQKEAERRLKRLALGV